MASLLFSNERFLSELNRQQQVAETTKKELFERLGVKPSGEKVITILVVAKDAFAGYEAIFTLAIDCEINCKKQVDVNKIRIIVLSDLEKASKSPHLERASFILISDENLLDVREYPELEKILPFLS